MYKILIISQGRCINLCDWPYTGYSGTMEDYHKYINEVNLFNISLLFTSEDAALRAITEIVNSSKLFIREDLEIIKIS